MDTSLLAPVGMLHNKEKGNHERDVTKVQTLFKPSMFPADASS